VPGFWPLVIAVLVSAFTIKLLNIQQNWLDKRLPWTTGIGRRFVVQLSLAGTSTLVPALAILLLFIAGNLTGARSFLRFQDLAVVTAVSATLVALTVLLNLGLFLMRRWRESSLEAERYRKENVEFRFEMLRNQVNPHFLFNSLNTLASLVYTDADTASNFLRELARVYRYVLETGEKELTPLKQELTFLDAFIYMIKIRYAEGLDIQIHVSDDALKGQLPPLTLQLLVENAIKHNIVSASKPLKITIKADADTVTVSNNLQPKLVPEAGTHTGLSNIRNRYAYLTDKQVVINQTADSFNIQIPLLKPDEKL
jgi:LytS/YehU family sensor histidine kinase